MTVTTIETNYMGHAEFTATYLVDEGGRGMFVETATAHATDAMMRALQVRGVSPESVDYIVITHVHLDHAGGASALMQLCPHATLLAHPRAAKHAIEPSKLVASAKQVYGEVRFDELYPDVKPIEAARVRAVADEEVVNWQGHSLRFLHTRGHANHHACMVDETENCVFTGDSFGLAYPQLQADGLFVIPSTSPTDFDADAARASVQRIVQTHAACAYLTHYGAVQDLFAVAGMLDPQLARYGAMVVQADSAGLEGEPLDAWCAQAVRALFDELLPRHGLDHASARATLAMDIDLNAQGVAAAVRKRRFKRSQAR